MGFVWKVELALYGAGVNGSSLREREELPSLKKWPLKLFYFFFLGSTHVWGQRLIRPNHSSFLRLSTRLWIFCKPAAVRWSIKAGSVQSQSSGRQCAHGGIGQAQRLLGFLWQLMGAIIAKFPPSNANLASPFLHCILVVEIQSSWPCPKNTFLFLLWQ